MCFSFSSTLGSLYLFYSAFFSFFSLNSSIYIDGEIISTTGEHPFWTPDLGWVEAKDLHIGSLLQTEDGRIIDVDGVDKREGNFIVYNFKVEGFHTYFVSDLGILVHNADCTSIAKEFRSYFKRKGETGEIITIKPAHNAPFLPEPQAGFPDDIPWGHHDVFVKDGMVYDPMGLGTRTPMPYDEWLSHYGNDVIVTSGPSR
ncbi:MULTISPECIES: polymorphic toxin-type HINT domain-containing protein [Pseudanabaena]|uniref:Uncharacterized protein n=2 Tax=Pseudanabaena TaxID=1152 RepID=L8N3P8_9CYAN|nr:MULTISPECIES: polymorphic toxin-type HINT domain-containing protein [Pseudanabaena]ELS33335.1 hypothetical protein Pse7429DRAFT_2334 [Pseudanabaena biceps PCC 7429]MDG3494432.1 polymorphic toxin-type HINT domain-containing protein [Pseudanabaena catenata USMAC16]